MPHARSSSGPRWTRWPLGLGVALAFVLALVWAIRSRTAGPSAAAAASASAAAAARVPALRIVALPRAGVRGHVADEAGKAIPGARVCAWAAGVGGGTGLVTSETRAPRCTDTDATGDYTLADLFPRTPLTLTAVARGFAPRQRRGAGGAADELRLDDGQMLSGIDFALPSGGVELRGRALDVTGGVVPGALVVADRGIATTDEKGEFSLWVEPGQAHLTATATGYAPGRANGPVPGHFFSIHLVPGATLVGRAVVAGSDAPVTGARVESIQVEGGGTRASTRTDDEGRFRIEGLSPGRYRIEATSEGREGYSRASITLGMGETSQEVVVELDPAYVVQAHVVDKATGKPCPGGEVTITDKRQNEFSQGTIEPDGRVRMASVLPGTYAVEISCKGYVARDDLPPVVITDRDAPELRWEVDKGASVRVVLFDGDGKPVPKATVSAWAKTPGGDGGGGSSSEPDADGVFVITGLKPGEHSVSARAQDGRHGEAEVVVDARREERVKIELPTGGVIEGIVEDDDRRPVPNVGVSASGPRGAMTRTLDDGTFVLSGMPSGDYSLAVSERGAFRRRPDEDDRRVKVTVTAPQRVRTKLVVQRRDGVLAGRVRDASGQPVTDAFIDYVRATGSGKGVPRYGSSGRAPILTSTDGAFVIEGLEAGEYNLRAYRKGGGEATADHVKTGTRDLGLTIAEGASISGTLTSSRGPVERYVLRAQDTKSPFSRMELFFHARGTFTLGDLPPGTYRVVAETPEGTATTTVTLAAGEKKTGVALTLALRGVVEGRVLADDGAPVAGARIAFEGESDASIVEAHGPQKDVTGADGRFRIEGVLPGAWKLVALPPSGAHVETRVDVVVGDAARVDAGTITVKKRPPQGE